MSMNKTAFTLMVQRTAYVNE